MLCGLSDVSSWHSFLYELPPAPLHYSKAKGIGSSQAFTMDIPHTVFDYEPINYAAEDFRLLKLLGSRDDDIKCRLYHVKFDSEPYEALSYAWGVLELVEPIEVNGRTLRVTDNLYAALRHLRLPDRDRVLWIDAICINQEDKHEQSDQVQRMRSVYQNAERVIVWLGKATVEVEILFQWLRQLEKRDVAFDASEKAPEDPRLVIGLQTLLRRSWFERVWILQEIANAKSALICAGKESISASVFASALGYLDLELDSHYHSVLKLMSRKSTPDMPCDQDQDLCTLLLKFQGCKASDERDKVFALLDMLSTRRDSLEIIPDYTLPLPEVVQRTIQYMFEENDIANDKVLDFLTSFSSLTTVCVGPDTGDFLYMDSEHNIDDMRLRALINKVPFIFILELKSTQARFESETTFGQAAQLSISERSVRAKQWNGSMKTFTWGQNVKVLLVQNISNVIIGAHLSNCHRIVEVLITHGTALGAGPGFLSRTLLQAATQDESELVQLLIEKGANINARSSAHEFTWLQSPEDGNVVQVASQLGCRGSVEVLIKAGADVNDTASEARSALEVASDGGYADIVRMLIEAGADINGKGGHPETPLSSAALQGHEKTVEVLIEYGAIANAWEWNIPKALRSAAKQRNAKIVEMLVSAGVDVNARERFYPSALRTASERGHSWTTKVLVEAGADLDVIDDDNSNAALLEASYEGHEGVVEILLDAGADVNSRGGWVHNALESALSRGHACIAQMLLDHGAEVDAVGGGECCNALRKAIAIDPEKAREIVMRFEGQTRMADEELASIAQGKLYTRPW